MSGKTSEVCGACGRQRMEHDDQQHYYCATVNLQAALTRELAAREAAEKERDEATAHAAVVQRLLDIDHEKVLAGNAALAAERVANAGLRAEVRVALGTLQDPALILQTRTRSEWVESSKWEYRLYNAIIKAMGILQDAHDAALSAAPPLPMEALRAASVEECPTCHAPLVYCGGELRPPPLQRLNAEQLAHHGKPISKEDFEAALAQGEADRRALEASTPRLPGRFAAPAAAPPAAAPQDVKSGRWAPPSTPPKEKK